MGRWRNFAKLHVQSGCSGDGLMPLSAKRVLTTKPYAMYFDGIDDYVNCGNNPSLNTTTEATVEAVFYSLTEPWLKKDGVVFGKGDWAITNSIGLCCWHEPRIYFGISSATVGYIANYWVNHYGKWWFIAGTVKARELTKVYDSGVLKVTISASTSPWDLSKTNLFIARDPRVATYFFKGYIHTIRYYNRVLSDTEIQYNLNNPNNPIRDGLVLWFVAHPDNVKDIDNDGILEWVDLSGNNNHGKIYGATIIKLVKDQISVSQPKRIMSVIR
jgi:hypothetical protein